MNVENIGKYWLSFVHLTESEKFNRLFARSRHRVTDAIIFVYGEFGKRIGIFKIRYK